MIWSEEDIAHVKHLAEVDGLSTGQIAKELNLSRSAISGIINRRNIQLTQKYKIHGGITVKEKRTKFKPNKAQIMIAESYIPPVEQRMSLMELKSNSCRWPLGDGPTYFFCGGEAKDNLPYCEAHCAIAYNAKREPFDPTRKRDRNSI